ncbi:MFS superfamily sulfate permease-like transporter [Bradyrhizobium sp. USDA 4518]
MLTHAMRSGSHLANVQVTAIEPRKIRSTLRTARLDLNQRASGPPAQPHATIVRHTAGLMSIQAETSWMRWFPPANWLADYRASWLGADAIAGVTLAAYAIPVSLAYAGLAGLPPQIGVYGYLLGGVGYALLGSSRQLAVGPTSAISLMIAGAVGILAGGDAARYGQIASLVAFSVAVLCLIAWLFKLSLLVRLISDSILVGFKAGAGLTIIMSQLPSLFGVAGGGHNFFDRVTKLAGQLGDTRPLVLGFGVAAIVLLLLGEKRLPGKPIGLAVVALSILAATAFGLAELGLPVTGPIPTGLPTMSLPTFGLLEFDDLFPIAAGCLVLAYVEGVSAARSLRQSMATRWMSDRSFWDSARPISPRPSGMAIPLPAGCRSRP